MEEEVLESESWEVLTSTVVISIEEGEESANGKHICVLVEHLVEREGVVPKMLVKVRLVSDTD